MSENSKTRLDDLSIDGEVFVVLVNGEGQYSVWPAGHDIPEGWSRVGPMGSKAECLAFIEANWKDMRPKTLRQT